MYMELTPQDTIKDLQRLLIQAIPNFEFPRKNLYNYEIKIDKIDEEDLNEDDFVLGLVWEEIIEEDTILENPGEEGEVIQKPKSLVENSSFEDELTSEEVEILAILMMIGWLQRQITSIENTRMKYSGSDFKMTSQANHISKLQSLLNECQRQSHHAQRLYKRRQFNEDGKYESTWFWFGENGTTNI